MMGIPQKYVELLKLKGLHVCEPFPVPHIWAGGARIGKPSTTHGNSIKGFDSFVGSEKTDATSIILYEREGTWFVLAQEHVPMPAADDFENRWNTIDDAIVDILDFYFGDPSRMLLKEASYLDSKRLVQEFFKERAEAEQNKLDGK